MVSSSAILFLLVHTVQCAVLASIMQYSMSIKRKLHSYERTIIDDDLKSF